MQQAALFAPEPLALVHDAEGGIRYWPNRISPACARQWCATLCAQTPWHSARRPMYDRIVDVPRLQAGYPLHDRARPCPPLLLQALAVVRELVDAPFTHVGLNLYRDGRDSVAMHGDKLHRMAAGHPVVLLSLGDPRDMLIRSRTGAHRPLRIALEPGSVLAMSHASQLTHEHGIPKTRAEVGTRISCAFRVRPLPDVGSPL